MGDKLKILVISSALLTVVLLSLILFLIGNIKVKKIDSRNSKNPPVISQLEKDRIDHWIYKQDLNPYGESQETVYNSGTPLFNETTGQKMDRYLYIWQHHSDRPWDKGRSWAGRIRRRN